MNSIKHFICIILTFIFSSHSLFADETPKKYKESIDICKEPCTVQRPYDFDVTVEVGPLSVTFHVHCESTEDLLVFIATGLHGCDVARESFPLGDDNNNGRINHHTSKESLIAAIEKASKMESGSLTTIEVRNSTIFKVDGKFFGIKRGKYKVERNVDYPLDFKFEVVEISKEQIKNKNPKKIKSKYRKSN